MTYDLVIGDRGYSSWSLRGWLLFDAFGIPVRTHLARLASDQLPQMLRDYGPARTAPTLRTPDGAIVFDSLAIAEELASRHPEAGHWPADPKFRAVARSLVAEMHAGFGGLRSHCAMNLRKCYSDCSPTAEVDADLRRLEAIWDWARDQTGSKGPWLCGDYGTVDAMFAPVAARIAGHSLPVNPAAQRYVAAHLAHPSFRRWRAMGQVDLPDLPKYARDWPTGVWPGPVPLSARAIETGTPENSDCPYSGDPVTHLAEIEGRVFGFCNAFCRDKTVADAAAWPKFMAIFNTSNGFR